MIKKNLIWILLIILIINTTTYLLLRYWPEEYESYSELKLDIISEASDFGFNTFQDDQNLISGEIEFIRSKLFLNRVLDSLNLDVTYFNQGDLLNFELFGHTPYKVKYYNIASNLYDLPIFLEEKGKNNITLQIGQQGQIFKGRYGEKISIPSRGEFIIHNNPSFERNPREDLNFFFVINSRPVLLSYLLKNLSVIPLNFNANTIKISFRDKTPQKAAKIINKVDSLYLTYSSEQKNLANKQKIDWLSNELHQIEMKLGQYENYFEDFVLENKTNDLDEDLKKTIEIINGLDSQRYQHAHKIGLIKQIKEEMVAGALFYNPVYKKLFPQPLSAELLQLEKSSKELDNLRLSYSENTFAYKNKKHDVERLYQGLLGQMDAYLQGLQKDLENLNQRKATLEKQFSGMPSRNTQFNKNQRFYQLYETFYLSLMQSKSEFEIAIAGTTPNFKVLSPASIPSTPITPNKLMITGVGIVVSLIISFFFIGIAYLLNNKITSLTELEHRLSFPILGIIPNSRYPKEKTLQMLNHPKSIVSEAFRSIRTNLDFFNLSSPSKVIAISSTVSGEGKSFIAMNLGAALALSKKKVILLDLDLRKNGEFFVKSKREAVKGISTILIKKHTFEDCVQHSEVENLDYLFSGPLPPNPSELLVNGEFTDLLENLKKQYDYIILDTPPVGLVTDGIMAMKQADLCIYVFRANYSKKEFIFNLKRITNINKFSNITIILNAQPSDSKTYGHEYYEDPGKENYIRSLLRIFRA